MSIQVGDTFGDYEVIGLLGKGGMGRVYRVRNTLSGREEAMKAVLPDLDENPDLAGRFLREIQVHASLVHPNIAAMHTALRIEGRVVMLLELVEGTSLSDIVAQGAIPVPQAVSYVSQVLSALDFAHGRGVIHRDIKPANILLTREGVVKLTDFGIAHSAANIRLTMTGMAVGSLPYMSPEQVRSEPPDARSDLYSLGATFYEMVTGRRAIQGDSEYSLMNAQLTHTPAAPADLATAIPRTVSDAIMRAMEKDPARRFQSAREFQSVLNGAEALAMPARTAPLATAIPAEDLVRIEARLSRVLGPIARRLVADEARRCSTVAELCAGLGQFIADAAERKVFLGSCDKGEGTVTAPAVPAAGIPRIWEPDLLTNASQALAVYVGPIAKMVVNRAAKKAANEDELYAKLAAEIPGEADRKRFTAAVRKK